MDGHEEFGAQRRLLNPKELAAYLGVSTRTIQNLTSSGRIPCVRVGSKLPRYSIAAVVEALEEQRRRSAKNEVAGETV